MQEQINARTRELEQVRDRNRTLSDAERREYASLAEEQGKLADLLLDMSKPEADVPEDSPDKLPDVRPQPRDEAPSSTEKREETP